VSVELLHKTIETHIETNLPAGIKRSYLENNPRDFSLPNSPMFFEGTEDFIIFKVKIEKGSSATVGNKAVRRVGIVSAEVHSQVDATDRTMYKMFDILSTFLERKNFSGISFRDSSLTGDIAFSKWRRVTWTFSFITTQMIV